MNQRQAVPLSAPHNVWWFVWTAALLDWIITYVPNSFMTWIEKRCKCSIHNELRVLNITGTSVPLLTSTLFRKSINSPQRIFCLREVSIVKLSKRFRNHILTFAEDQNLWHIWFRKKVYPADYPEQFSHWSSDRKTVWYFFMKFWVVNNFWVKFLRLFNMFGEQSKGEVAVIFISLFISVLTAAISFSIKFMLHHDSLFSVA